MNLPSAPRAGPSDRDYSEIMIESTRLRCTLRMLLADDRPEAIAVATKLVTLADELMQAVWRRELERKARR